MSSKAAAPTVSPWVISISVMLATFMEVLDTAIANVSLPHIAGNLSADLDEATWVITSYLVSNAIVLPASAWFSRYFGRKRFLITCVIIFTASSFVCGIAPSLTVLIIARVVQGAGGGALQPLSQAIMLESFPQQKRGMAMAMYAVGVIVAPIIGPILGGWITDNYSWRWIFYINIPVGIFAVTMIMRNVHDPEHITKAKTTRIDAIGFGLMAVGIGALQIILDKGQEDDWFAATWIRVFTLVCAVALIAFLAWELKHEHPIVNLRVLKDRNFAMGTLLMAIVGFAVYVPLTLLPEYLQNLMNYTAQESGIAQCTRGLGVLLMTAPAGFLTSRMDNRKMIAAGFFVNAVAIYWLSRLNLDMAVGSVAWPNFLQGLGMAFVFVPLTTTAVSTLKDSQIGDATGLFNLMRNLGASVGISVATTLVARHAQLHQVILVSHATPFDAAYQARLHALNAAMAQPNLDWGQSASPALGLMYQEIIRQSTALAYADTFRWLALLCVLSVPTIMLLKRAKAHGPVMME